MIFIKNKIMLIISLLVASSLLFHVQAANVEVNWIKPDKFSDIKAGQGHRKRFKERTLMAFEEHFQTLANQLPQQQKLNIKRIRIIKDIYIPRISLNYTLLNADGGVIKEAEVKLKDMSFMRHANIRQPSKTLSYEKTMLDKWFSKTFLFSR